MKDLREHIRQIILEAFSDSEKRDIEKIVNKSAKPLIKKEIDKALGKDLEKLIKKEVEKSLKDKATQKEIADITKNIIKKLYRTISVDKQHIIDRL